MGFIKKVHANVLTCFWCQEMGPPKALLVVKMDGDGDCLFHALAYHLGAGETGGALRQRLIDYMEQEALEQPGWESEPLLEEAGALRAGAWGGNTAMAMFSKMAGVWVKVHTKEPGKDVAVKDWTHENVSANNPMAEVFHLLFNGSDHYDVLKEVEYQAGAMQAAWQQPPPPAYTAPIEAFPALNAEGELAARSKRKEGFKAPRPSKKGKANKKPALKTEAPAPAEEDETGEATAREDESDPEKGRNKLLEQLQAIPITETSLHPHRQVEDLIQAGFYILLNFYDHASKALYKKLFSAKTIIAVSIKSREAENAVMHLEKSRGIKR